MILLLLRCGLLPEQAEAQRREQGDGVGEQLRRAADAHEQVIDGVVDDGDAEQAEQARRAERAAAPYGAGRGRTRCRRRCASRPYRSRG